MNENDSKPVLLTCNQAASLCRIKKSLWYSLNSSGRVPSPIRIGDRVFWLEAELTAWIEAGCPPRSRWDAIKKQK